MKFKLTYKGFWGIVDNLLLVTTIYRNGEQKQQFKEVYKEKIGNTEWLVVSKKERYLFSPNTIWVQEHPLDNVKSHLHLSWIWQQLTKILPTKIYILTLFKDSSSKSPIGLT